MKSLFLMILLTSNGAGDIASSFINTTTMEDCQLRMSAVKGIFMSANVDLVASRCIRSDLRFSPFEHKVSSDRQRYFYLVDLAQEVPVQQHSDWASCIAAMKPGVAEKQAHCSSSLQRLLR